MYYKHLVYFPVELHLKSMWLVILLAANGFYFALVNVACVVMPCCGVLGVATFLPVLWVSATSPAAAACPVSQEGKLCVDAMPRLHRLYPDEVFPIQTSAGHRLQLPLWTWALRSIQRGMISPSKTWTTCLVSGSFVEVWVLDIRIVS